MSTTPDLSLADWTKSSYSNGNGGNCLEWAPQFVATVVPVRDSKVPAGPALLVHPEVWSAFVGAIRDGHLLSA